MKYFLLFLLVCTSVFAKAETFYWVGGSGKWSDVKHWASVSGGEPKNKIPESGSDIIIDNNSTASDNSTIITLTDNIVVNSLSISTNRELLFNAFKEVSVKGTSITINSTKFKSFAPIYEGESLVDVKYIGKYFNYPLLVNRGSGGGSTQTPSFVTGFTVTKKDVTCGGDCDGRLIVNATSSCIGSITVCYFGDAGTSICHTVTSGNNDTLDNLCKNGETFNIVVTDCDETVADGPYTIVGAAPIVFLLTANPVITKCFGVCNGTENITTFGGNGPSSGYTYSWSDGVTTKNRTDLCASVSPYVVTVTDTKGCTEDTTITVNNPTAVDANLTQVNATCSGGSDGSASTAATGGTGVYTYTWYNSSSTVIGNSTSISPLAVGNYAILVKDGNGCKDSVAFTIGAPSAITVTGAPVNASCFSVCDGSIPLTLSGGTGAYSAASSPALVFTMGATTATATAVCADVYSITITDAVGCSTVVSKTVTQPAQIFVAATATPSTYCAGESSTLSASSATVGMTYVWTGGTTTPSTGASVSTSVTTSTTFTVTGTDPANSCTTDTTVSVTVNSLPVIETTPSAPPVCVGGAVQIVASNTSGLATTYSWSPNACGIDVTTGSTVNVSPPSSGSCTFTVTGTDINGCVNDTTVIVTANPPPSVTLTLNPSVSCAGLPVDATASGAGVSGTYSWFCTPAPDANLSSTSGVTITVTPTASVSLTVIGTDVNGCQDTAVKTITINPLPVVVAAATSTTICEGLSTTLSATNGMSSYSWTDGASEVMATSGTSTVIVSPTTSTTYTVIVFDSFGCTNTDEITITVNPKPVADISALSPVCSGVAQSATASPAGMATYSWYDGGATTIGTTNPITISSTSATIYTVEVVDANGCKDTAVKSVTVNNNPAATSTASPNPICDGSTTTLTGFGSGGTGSYTFTWNDAGGQLATTDVTTQTVTANTTYTVTVIDGNGCQDTSMIPVAINTLPPVTANAASTTICGNTCTNLTGGGALTYTWEDGTSSLGSANPITVCPTTTTTYTVTGVDINGCSNTANITITVNTPPVASITAQSPVCSGVAQSVTALPAGMVTYSWYDGATLLGTTNPLSVTATSSLVYTVQVMDGNGCKDTATVNVAVNNNPGVTPSATPGTICNGGSTSLSAIGSGGSGAGYTFTWSPAATLNPADGIGNPVTASPTVNPTVYTVKVTDSNGCIATNTVSVNINALPTVTITPANPTICGNTCTSLTVNGAVSYSWTEGVTSLGSSNPISVCPATTTTYTVTGTDGNGCSNIATVTVDVNTPPVASISTASPVCSGTAQSLTASPAGMTTYSWYDGTGTNIGISNPLPISSVSTVIYTVEITDGNGCKDTSTVNVTVNNNPSVTPAATPSTICVGSSTSLSAVGSSGDGGPYTFTWSETGATLTPSDGIGNPVSASPTVNPTIYTVTVRDGNDCVGTNTVSVTVNGIPDITPNNPTICSGTCATLTASSSVVIVSYDWRDSNNVQVGTTASVSVCPTTNSPYTVTVTDINGCTGSATTTVNVNPLLPVSVLNDTAICIGDTATLMAFSSGIGVTYTWSGVLMTPSDGIGSSIIAMPSPAGTYAYTVTATDASGCSNTDVMNVTVNALPTVTTNGNQEVCIGSSINLTASGASTYTWSPTSDLSPATGIGAVVSADPSISTTYTVTGTDGNGCVNTANAGVTVNPLPTADAGSNVSICFGGNTTLNGSGGIGFLWSGAGLSNSTISNPVASPTVTTLYSLTVTDAKGCTDDDTVRVTVNTISVDAGTGGIVCFNGTKNLSALPAGGTYIWSPSTGLNNAGIQSPVATVTAAITYSVTVTDANGCIGTDTIQLSIDQIVVSNSVTNPSICGATDGSIDATVTGGISGLNFSWNSGQLTEDINAIGAGSYTLTVTDGLGCKGTASSTITDPFTGNVDSLVTNPSTCTGADGSIDITVTGALGPVYSWSSGEITEDISSLSAGAYTVTITDAGGCQFIKTFVLTDPTPVPPNAGNDTSICIGSVATLNGNLNGGSNPVWSHGPTTAVTTDNPSVSTLYTLSVTDATGCAASDNVTITVNGLPVVSAGSDINACENTSVPLNASGATSYSWSSTGTLSNTAISNPNATVLSVSMQNIVVGTNANGCSSSDTMNIIVNPFSLSETHTDATGCALQDGTIDVTTSGGFPVVTYVWSPGGQVTEDLSGLGLNNYTLVATDGAGCTNTLNVSVSENSSLSITEVHSNVSACSVTDGSISLTVAGGNGTITYTWTGPSGFTSNSKDLTGLAAGTYDLVAVDSVGCGNALSVIITQPSPTIVSAGSDVTICAGSNTNLSAAPAGSGTYSWYTTSAVGATSTVSVSPGVNTVYNVMLTDASGCVSTDSVEVFVSTVDITTTPTNVSVCGGSDGSITVTVSNATPPYSYSWSNSAPDAPVASGLVVGPYSVAVTDANGCVGTASDTINDPSNITVTNISVDPTICGGTDGSIDITISGGSLPYTTNWGAFGLSEDLSNLVQGSYTVTITDALNCSKVRSYILSDPTPITADGGPDVSICSGQTIGLSSASAGVSYDWSSSESFVSGQTTSTPVVNPTSTADYTLITTDAKSCKDTDIVVVTVNASPTATINASATNICSGTNVSLTATGGGSYTWTPATGLDQTDISNPTATVSSTTTYTVDVINAFGCTDTKNITITAGAPFTLSVAAINPTGCSSNNGTLVATTAGGSGSFAYSWSTTATTQVISGLDGGFYSVIVTDQTTTCIDTATGTLAEPVTFSLSTNMVSTPTCTGTGTIDLTVSPTATYTYSWSNGAVSEDITDVAGIYFVNITDGSGCTMVATDTIEAPLPMQVDAGADQTVCPGATVSLNASNSVSYVWSTPVSYSPSANVANPFVTPGSTTNYVVTGTDANGCTSSDTIAVFVGTIILAETHSDVTSCGGTDGAINLTVVGGATPYTYAWSNGPVTEDQVGSLPAASYQVIVTDAASCTDTLSVDIASPAVFALTEVHVNPATCGSSDGSITVTIPGSVTGPVATVNGAPATIVANTISLSGLPAGFYSIVVTDASGCSASVGITLTSPVPIQVYAGADAYVCGSGTSLTLAASPATLVSYAWTSTGAISNANSFNPTVTPTSLTEYTVTAIDANGCTTTDVVAVDTSSLNIVVSAGNTTICGGSDGTATLTIIGSTGALTYTWDGVIPSSQNQTNLAAGTHTITVNDVLSGCSANGTAIVADPVPYTVSFNSINPTTCSGTDGSIDVTVSGGSNPFTYTWSTPPGAITEDISSLAAGIYTVTVTDGGNCTGVYSDTLADPTPSALFAGNDTTICGGSTVNLNATSTFTTYVWSSSIGSSFTASNSISNPSVTPVATDILTLVAVDANNCQATDTLTITVNSFSISSIVVQPSSCVGTDGQITVNVTGGSGSFTHSWNTGSTSDVLTNLSGGAYTDTIQDLGSGCKDTAMFNLAGASPITYVITQETNPTKCGLADGVLDFTTAGTTGQITYTMDAGPGITTPPPFTNLAAGPHTLVITDASLCTNSYSFTLMAPTTIPVSAGADTVICGSGTSATLTASPASGLSSVTWTSAGSITNPNSFTPTINPTAITSYFVSATDTNLCTSADTVVVRVDVISVSLVSTNTTGCGATDGTITSTVAGGISPLTYTWEGVVSTPNQNGLSAGVYTLVVTDSAMCQVTDSASVSDPVPYSVTFSNNNPTTCGGTNGSIDMTVSGGTLPYTYTWSNNVFTEDNSPLDSGIYIVTIKDANNCTALFSDTITDPTPTPLSAGSNAVICSGTTVNLNATAGFTSYSWTSQIGTGFVASDTIANPSVTPAASDLLILTAVDSKNCTSVDSLQITVNSFTFSSSATSPTTCLGTDGQISVTPVGGSGNFAHNWSNDSATATITNLIGGTYIDSIADVTTGCIDTAMFILDAASSITATVTTQTNPTRCGAADGIIDFTTTGTTGTVTYTINSNPPITVPPPYNFGAGTYTIKITDQSGCSKTLIVTLTDPTPVQITTGADIVMCVGDTVTLTSSPLAGFSSVIWSPNTSGELTCTSCTSPLLTVVSSTAYIVTGVDTNSCITTDTINVTAGSLVLSAIAADNTVCAGSSGSVNLTVTSGTGNYSYAWSPNNETTEDLFNLSANSYTVTVTDLTSGCVDSTSAIVNDPVPYTASSVVTDNTLCNGTTGAIDVTVSPAGTYTFDWAHSSNSSEDYTSLSAGIYSVVIKDAAGCTKVLSDTVKDPTPASLGTMADVAICNGSSLGLSASAGFTNYNWLPNSNINNNTIQNPVVSPSTTVNYTVSALDANNCVSRDTVLVTVNSLTASVVVTDNTICGDSTGAIDVTVTEGLSPFTYSWSNGALTEDIDSLRGNIYSQIITDANGCKDTIVATVADPAAFTASFSSVVNPISCNTATGSIDIATTGTVVNPVTYTINGTPESVAPPFSKGAGSYVVVVQDGTGCKVFLDTVLTDPAPVQVNAGVDLLTCSGSVVTLTALPAVSMASASWSSSSGSFSCVSCLSTPYTISVDDTLIVMALDINNCPSVDSVIVDSNILLLSVTSSDNTVCAGNTGSIDLTVTGGTGNYTYTWNTIPTQNTQDISSLAANVYTCVVADTTSGCRDSISTVINDPVTFTDTTLVTDNVKCGGAAGSIDLTVSPAGTYTFLWTPTGSITEDISGVVSGAYSVLITDAAGCTLVALDTISDPNPVQVNAGADVTICNGSTTTLQASSGYLSYTWSPGNFPMISDSSSDTPVVMITNTTSFIVNATDTNNCVSSDTVTITVNTIGINVISTDNPNCNDSVGTINLTITSGTSPFVHNWSNGAITEDISNLYSDIYVDSISDGAGCIDTVIVVIKDPVSYTVTDTAIVSPTLCGSAGSITLTITGGVGLTYMVDTVPNVAHPFTGLLPGQHDIVISDATNCKLPLVLTVDGPVPTPIDAGPDTTICFGASVTLSATPSAGGTFDWSPATTLTGATTATPTATPTDTSSTVYALSFTDANNCVTKDTVIVYTRTIQVTDTIITKATDCQATTGAIDVTIGGGFGPYSYSWTPNGQITEDITGVSAGKDTLTVTEASNLSCKRSFVFNVGVLLPLSVVSVNDSAYCLGDTIQLEAAGAENYTWYELPSGDSIGTANPITVSPSVGTWDYFVVGKTGFCVDTDSVAIVVNTIPYVDAGEDFEMLEGNPELIGGDPTNQAGTSLSWTPSTDIDDPIASNPTANPKVSTVFYVTVTDAIGCKAVDSISVIVYPSIKVPEGLTPNGDGINEVWIIDFINKYPQAKVWVYNRWGELIFESAPGYPDPWDGKYNGKDLPVGTYYYIIDLKDAKVKPYTGPITIMR